MAILRTYSGTFAQNPFDDAALARLRFAETTGGRAADAIGGLDGRFESGFELDRPGPIGDGAIRLDGTGRVLLTGEVELEGTPTIAAFGDSLVANFEVPGGSERFSPQLELALAGEGIAADVQAFGVSGETFEDALARVGTVLAVDPDLVIVVFGTNDSRAQRPLGEIETDMRALVGQLTEGGADVLLTGTFGFFPDAPARAYPTVADRDAFEALFAEVASDVDGVTLLRDAEGNDKYLGGDRVETAAGPTIVGGVLGDAALSTDGLHPNAAGVDRIVGRILEPTVDLLARNEPALALAEGSVEMWLTPEAIGGQQILFARNVLGFEDGDVEAELVDGAIRVSMQDSAGGTFQVTSAASGIEASAGEALHVVFTFGARGMQLFVNGELVDQNGFTGTLADNGVPFSIGAANEGGDFLNGTVDEFALYDQAFGEDRVAALFESGTQGVRLVGTKASDDLFGGVDDERFEGRSGPDLIVGGAGDDLLNGGRGADSLRGQSGGDVLRGGRGTDQLFGHAGDDQVMGRAGADLLHGGGGDDLLNGGGGRDVLNGGAGLDTLRGGGNADTFVLGPPGGAPDRILDFEAGPSGDVLELGDVLDELSSDLLRLTENGSDTRLEVDQGGGFTAAADLVGATGLDLDQLIADGNVVTA